MDSRFTLPQKVWALGSPEQPAPHLEKAYRQAGPCSRAPRAPTLLQDITAHFPKFPQGNKDRLTDTHERQHEVALTWKPLGTQQSAVQKTHSFMHWAVGVGAGSRGPEEVGGHSPPCPSKSPVSTGEGTGDTAYIGWGRSPALLFPTALEF